MCISEYIKKCRRRGRALLSINVFDYQTFRAMAFSFGRNKRNVIAQFSAKFFERTAPLEVVAWRNEVGRQVLLHLDHCTDRDLVVECAQAGFDSVMFDASQLPLKHNILNSQAVKREVRKINPKTLFEGEVGHVHGIEDGFGSDQAVESPLLEDVLKYYRKVEPDLLAVGFGNMHGHYKGGEKFDLELMESVHSKLPKVAKVLHGGSGMALSLVEQLVQWGHCKINISSDLKVFWLETNRAVVNDDKRFGSPIAVTHELDRRILGFFDDLQEKYASCLL